MSRTKFPIDWVVDVQDEQSKEWTLGNATTYSEAAQNQTVGPWASGVVSLL
jgi:hypothetical protein